MQGWDTFSNTIITLVGSLPLVFDMLHCETNIYIGRFLQQCTIACTEGKWHGVLGQIYQEEQIYHYIVLESSDMEPESLGYGLIGAVTHCLHTVQQPSSSNTGIHSHSVT